MSDEFPPRVADGGMGWELEATFYTYMSIEKCSYLCSIYFYNFISLTWQNFVNITRKRRSFLLARKSD